MSASPVAVANNRICLALLRIYRHVPLATSELDFRDLMRPLWPLVREEPIALRAAIRGLGPKPGPNTPRKSRSVAQGTQDFDMPDWMQHLLDPDVPLSAAQPDTDVLTMLAEALIFNQPCFRLLFDAMQHRLEKLVATQHAESDLSVEMLCELLGLSSTDRSLLTLCCALEIGTVGSSPFAQVQRPSRQIDALRAGLQLDSEHAVRAALGTQSPLMRSGLLNWDGRGQRDLEDVLKLSRQGSALLGSKVRSPHDMAAIVLKPLPCTTSTMPLSWPHLDDRTNLLEKLLGNTLKNQQSGINLLFYGAPGTGKSEYAAQLIKNVGVQGYSIGDADEDNSSASRNERLANLSLSQIFAPAQHSVLVLDEAEDIFQSDYNNPLARVLGKAEGSKSWMNGLLEGNATPVIWISNQVDHIDPAHLRRFTYCLEFPTTPRGVRRTIAQTHLSAVGCSPDLIESIASNEHVTPALLACAALFTRLTGAAEQTAADAAARHMLQDNLKAMGKEISASVAQRVTRFDIQYLHVKGLATPEKVISSLQHFGRGVVLLSGAPGTGKTQFAAEIAQRLGRELVYRTASDINTKWFGESERNVARMFTQCDPASEVLFLDEADTLMADREASGHRANLAVTSEFLRRVEAFEGVFVCATNHRARFDSALMRRFAFRLEFLPLNALQRERMFCETALGWTPDAGLPQPQFDPAALSRLARLDQLTPGDFANAVKRVRALQLDLNVEAWLDELEAEHDAKPQAGRSSIGFL